MHYVYAILDCAPSAISTAGICGESLQAKPYGRLYAVTGEIPEAPQTDEANLRGHERVIRELAAQTDAILPARFGSILRDDAMLAAREAEFLAALDLVRGREQMTLRIYSQQSAAVPEIVDESLRPSLGPGTNYLTAKKRALDQDPATLLLQEIHSALGELVKAERVRRQDTLTSVYHLIERGAGTAYISALERVAVQQARFAVSGPWPPYGFGPQEVI
jgi:hypothetical protein